MTLLPTSPSTAAETGRQRRVDQTCQNAAAGNVAEVTERHRDRLCDLGDKVHRGHDDDGLGEALQPAADSRCCLMEQPQQIKLVISAQVNVVDKSAVDERKMPVMPMNEPQMRRLRNSAPM